MRAVALIAAVVILLLLGAPGASAHCGSHVALSGWPTVLFVVAGLLATVLLLPKVNRRLS